MKSLYLAILISLYLAGNAFAAMVCVESEISQNGFNNYRLGVTCTFDATPGTAEDTIPDSIMAIINDDRFVYGFKVKPGSPGPTDDSDLEIKDADGFTIVSATGNGADKVDNTALTDLIYGDGPVAGTDKHYPMGDGQAWTITVTNNAVNNSVFELIMQAGE